MTTELSARAKCQYVADFPWTTSLILREENLAKYLEEDELFRVSG